MSPLPPGSIKGYQLCSCLPAAVPSRFRPSIGLIAAIRGQLFGRFLSYTGRSERYADDLYAKTAVSYKQEVN
jgi:hypothetical protein